MGCANRESARESPMFCCIHAVCGSLGEIGAFILASGGASASPCRDEFSNLQEQWHARTAIHA